MLPRHRGHVRDVDQIESKKFDNKLN